MSFVDKRTFYHTYVDPKLPKVFLYASRQEDGVYGYALAEDGSSLYVDVFRNHIYVRQGLLSALAKLEYDEYYPEGYQLLDYIDCPDEELDQRDDFIAALQANVNASTIAAEQRAAAEERETDPVTKQ